MAIQDDWEINKVTRQIKYTTAFVDDRPPTGQIYTVNELYSWLQDEFQRPAFSSYSVPMSAQTPTQYSMINGWFIDDNSVKALYGGSIQSNAGNGGSAGWIKSGAAGITQMRWQDAPTNAPTDPTDLGVTLTGGTSTATGVLLAIDTVRQVVWVRNTSAAQFQDNENITGTGVDFQTMATNGFQTGETVWANAYGVGSLQANTETYIGQEDDYMGGRAYHTANPEQRKIEKIDEWWDHDVDFATGSPNLLGGSGHVDLLIKVTEAGADIDSKNFIAFQRQFSKLYSHFPITGGVGNFVIVGTSTSADLNNADGPYQANFDANSGTIVVGDVLENGTGPGSNDTLNRLRAVVTGGTTLGSATGTIEYYLIGENEPLTTTDRTLVQLADNDDLDVRGGAVTFDVNGAASQVTNGPAQAGGVTITFSDTFVDVDETGATAQRFACTIDCNNLALSRVYKHVMFLCARGNQDGTVADTQDTLLQTAIPATDEPGEFYRAVGDIVLTANAKVGTGVAEGDYVVGQTSGAVGVVIATENTATGLTTLHQVKGTFVAEDISPDSGTNYLTVNAPVTGDLIGENTGAPFGTFAGGKWFLARGVVLTNVATADANNWQTIDLPGNTRIPPTTRNLTFAGLSAEDTVCIFEVDTPGGQDVTKNQNGIASGGAVGSTSCVLDSTIALNRPAVGWLRVPDASAVDGFEQRIAYSGISGTAVTFDNGAWSTGTTTGSESATVLTDTGAFTSFGGAGQIRRGMMIRNDTLGEWAMVLRKIDANSIETTPLSSGGNWHSGGTADTWTANAPVVAFDAADTSYIGFIDEVSQGATVSTSIKYVADVDAIARFRFSDPSIGGQRKLPFEQLGVTIPDADLTVTAVKNDDTIAA